MGEEIGFVTSRTSTIRTDMAFGFQDDGITIYIVIASAAKQSMLRHKAKEWIASSQGLLAMTEGTPQDAALSRKYGSTGP